jgi:hypothetical protein
LGGGWDATTPTPKSAALFTENPGELVFYNIFLIYSS